MVFQEIPLEEKEECFEKTKSYFNFFFFFLIGILYLTKKLTKKEVRALQKK